MLGQEVYRTINPPGLIDHIRGILGWQKNVVVHVMSTDYSIINVEGGYENAVSRRDTIRLTDAERIKKRKRLAIYQFLDHPQTASSFHYHFGIFVFVLISVIIGAVADASPEEKMIYNINYIMEVVLAVFFIGEFAVRIWSIGADARYKGFRGFLRYASRLVCLIDILIILVTFGLLFIDREKNRWMLLDVLRFIQILRLFHIDRQMSTWKMIYKMVKRSLFELMTAYFVVGMGFLFMAYFIFETEDYFHSVEVEELKKEGRIEAIGSLKRTFDSYGDAMWFTVVSFLTVGYGDIVPKHWVPKVIAAILAFLIYCAFVAALTIEDEAKMMQYSKMKNAAAQVIQHWYRYHLATHRKETWNMIPYFKHVCFKLYLADERLKSSRKLKMELEEKMRKKKEKKRMRFMQYTSMISQLTLDSFYDEKSASTKLFKSPFSKRSLKNFSIFSKSESEENMLDQNKKTERKSVTIANRKRAPKLGKSKSDDDLSTSLDEEDVDKAVAIDMLIKGDSFDSRRASFDANAIDERVLQKYRPLIRFFNFLLFMRCTKKFKRVRKPYQLLDAETELCEMEHTRNQHFHELRLRLEATIGKQGQSPFLQTDGKTSIERRLEACEQATEDINAKVQEMFRLAESIAEAVGCDQSPVQKERSVVQSITRETRWKKEELSMDPIYYLIEKFEKNQKSLRGEERKLTDLEVIHEVGEMSEMSALHTVPKRSAHRRVSIADDNFFLPPGLLEFNGGSNVSNK